MSKEKVLIKKTAAVGLVLFLTVALSGCAGNKEKSNSVFKASKKKNDTARILKETQKTMKERQDKNKTINFIRTVKKGEIINIKYRLRDYKDVSNKNQSLKAVESNLINLSGEASFRIKEIGQTTKLDSIHKAKGDKTYYYVIYEFKGSSETPTSKTIHPGSLFETGWDPAPALVIITTDNKPHYPSSANSWLFAKKQGLIKSLDIKLNNGQMETTAAVWNIDQNEKPVLALKYVDLRGEIKYIKIE
jgi:hypothetical protein